MNNNNNNSRNNNNNNNRRRGRNNNNNNRGGGGGGNQGNRIDSRARGNAPQMLEKYRKLAHDASLNDDRVLTEYYLQFADHYFRVIADMKAQKDEQQQRQGGRRDERGEDDDSDDGRDDNREDSRGNSRNERGEDSRGPSRDDNRDNDYDDRPRHQSSRGKRADSADMPEGLEGETDEGDNPFTPAPRREPRSEPRAEPRAEPRVRKPARARKPARNDDSDDAPSGLSADMLPPAIARGDDGDEDEAPARPARKPLRARTKRPPADKGDEETLEAVG